MTLKNNLNKAKENKTKHTTANMFSATLLDTLIINWPMKEDYGFPILICITHVLIHI